MWASPRGKLSPYVNRFAHKGHSYECAIVWLLGTIQGIKWECLAVNADFHLSLATAHLHAVLTGGERHIHARLSCLTQLNRIYLSDRLSLRNLQEIGASLYDN